MINQTIEQARIDQEFDDFMVENADQTPEEITDWLNSILTKLKQ